MFKPPLSNPALKRTLRPLYAQTQATPYAGFLDPAWNKSFDILPGTVLYRKKGEQFAPYTGAAGTKPFGLSAFFLAPNLGVDEISSTGNSNFTVWVGGQDSLFEILAPAFDAAGDWTLPDNGGTKLLTGNAQGKLTPITGSTAEDKAKAVAELIDVIGTDKIVVRLLPTQL